MSSIAQFNPKRDNPSQSYTARDGGDGGGDDMLAHRVDALEKRVGKVEDKIDSLSNRVNDLAVQIARIDGKLTHMPTSLQIIGIVGTIVGLAVAFLRLTS